MLMIENRKYIRFSPDENTLIDVELDGKSITGLATQEAYKGCSGIFVVNDKLQKDLKVKIKIGKLDQVDAIIRWTKPLEDKALEVGFEFEIDK